MTKQKEKRISEKVGFVNKGSENSVKDKIQDITWGRSLLNKPVRLAKSDLPSRSTNTNQKEVKLK